MFEKAKKNLWCIKYQTSLFQGLFNKEITEFDDELYNELGKVYYKGVPVVFYVKYLVTSKYPKYIEDRICTMFLSVSNALFVHGKTKILDKIYEMKSEEYEWIEIGDYVYDLYTLLKYKKETFYKIFSPQNVNKYTKEDFLADKEVNGEYEETFFISDGELHPSKEYLQKYSSFIDKMKLIALESEDDNFISDFIDFLYYITPEDEELVDNNKKQLKNNYR